MLRSSGISARSQDFLRRALDHPGRWQAGALVLAVCLLATLVLWGPLSLPATWINAGVKWVIPRSCTALGRLPFLENLCTGLLGLLTWAGSLLLLGLIYFYRRQVARLLTPLLDRAPRGYRFLAAPVLATALFTMGWAGNSFHWWTREGLVPDGLFPAVVGLMTHLMIWHGPGIQRRLHPWLKPRDRLTFKVRLVLTILASYLISVVLGNLVRPPVNDQLLPLAGLVIAYLLLAPYHGGATGPFPPAAGGTAGQPREEATGP